MLNFAMIGFGGLGKMHFANAGKIAERVKDIKLVGICDIEESAFGVQTAINIGESNANLDLSAYHLYTDVEELFEKEKLDFIITAIPTYDHEKVAVMAMERGIHVFSEKPMALNMEQAENMLQTARKNHVKLMIGQCVRHNSDYAYIKELIDTKKYGSVIRAEFSRISPNVTWAWQNWYLDEAKSGGAALDLHVHDVDYINWIFGAPHAVTSYATNHKTKHETIITVYHYDDDKLVTAIGDWGMPGCYRFAAGFTVRFEKATLVKNAEGLMLYPEEGTAELVGLPQVDGYVEEIVDFVNCIRENRESNVNPPESSLLSLKIALAEKVSADIGKTVKL